MKKIYIVDDSPINGKIISMHFDKAMIKNEYLKDIQELHSILEQRPESVDMVILDLVIPQSDGIEEIKKIRTQFNSIELPIIVLTANEEQQKIVEALQAGANDYLTKPVSKDIAIARVQGQLLMKQLQSDSEEKKEVDAINAIVATYGHEINNPLTIALLKLIQCQGDLPHNEVEIVLGELRRIEAIVKKIKDVTNSKIDYKNYLGESEIKMLKI